MRYKLPEIERSPAGGLPRMAPAQHRRANALIRWECCNYADGDCIALDDGDACACPQKISCPVQRQDRPAEPLAADGERNHLRTGAGVAIVQRKAVSVLAVAALPAYQAAGSSLLGRGYAVGGAVRPVFQRRQVLIGSFAHASLRFLWRVLFPRCLSIDELSQVYTFLTACAVYPRGRKSA